MFRPPASAQAIARVEAELGVTLPAEYKEILLCHDGQEDLAPMVNFCALLPSAELAEKRQWLSGLLEDEWQPSWLPIGHFQRNYLMLDLTDGRVFELYVDDDRRDTVAASCAELLSRFFREVQDGTIELAE